MNNLRGKFCHLTLVKADVSLTVPVGHTFIVRWLSIQLTTDATVASRTFLLRIYKAAVALKLISISLTATQTKYVQIGPAKPTGTNPVDDQLQIASDELILTPGMKLEWANTNEQAGDSWFIQGVYEDIFCGGAD